MPEYVATWAADVALTAFFADAATTTFVYYAAYVATVAAIVASSESAQRTARNKARDASIRSQRDRFVTVRNNLEPRRIVLGRRRTSGPIAYLGSYGADKEHLVYCVSLAGHEVDAIETIYFDDEPVVLDGSGNVVAILRTEEFAIDSADGDFFIAGEAEDGSVTAEAYYGSTVVPLVAVLNGLKVSVSGAHDDETGRLEIHYHPSPNPFKPTNILSGQQGTTGTGSLQHVTLAHTPIAGSVKVVERRSADQGGQTELDAVVTGTDVAFTAEESGNQIYITYQWSAASGSLARVRKYLGRMDQAADAGMIAALPDVWTSNHRNAGVAYLVVEFDYDREAFSGGEPNVSAIVRGLKCYDPRKNRLPSPLMEGAQVGTPGVEPTGWAISHAAGLVTEIKSVGTDTLTGWAQLTLRVSGTASAAGSVTINMALPANAPAASPGQRWSARCMVRRLAGDAWSDWTSATFRLVHYASDNSVVVETQSTISSAAVNGKQDPIQITDASAASGTVKMSARIVLGVANGQEIDQTLMVLMPQLWQGALGDDDDDPFVWSENPALLSAGYATHPIGGRLPWDQVDKPWLISEANACDTETTYTVGSKDFVRRLYTGGYVADTAQRPVDVLDDLCTAMGGEWAYVDGALRLRAGFWREPVLTIDESWLQGDQPVQIQAALERDRLVNCARGSFFDRRQAYRAVPFAPIEPDTYIGLDRAKLPLDAEFGAIDFEGQAGYVASCALREARQGQVVRLKCNMRAWQAQQFDNAVVSLARFGFDDKPYRVSKDGFTLDGGIELILRETGPSIWNIDAGFPATDPEPNTRLPDPWWVPEPTGLEAASGNEQLLLQNDGTVVSRVWITWDEITDPRVLDSTGFIDVYWRRMIDDPDEWKTVRVPGAAPGAYITPAPDGHFILVKARAIGGVGKSRDSEQILHLVLGKTANPSVPTGFTQSIVYGAVLLEWDACPDLDYAETELRRGADWETGVPLVGTKPTIVRGTKYQWSWPAFGSYTVRACHRDTSGHTSTTSAIVSVVVDDTIKLGSDGIDVDLAGINLARNSSYERDSNNDDAADELHFYDNGSVGTTTRSQPAGRITGVGQRRDATSLGTTTSDRLGWYQDIDVGAGAIQNLVVTQWMKTSANVTHHLQINVYNGSGTFITSRATDMQSDGSTWKRNRVDFTNLPATVEKLRIYCWIHTRTGASAPVWILGDDLQVEEGTLPSAWHPYPGESAVRIWIQATDPGAAAKENDEWVNTSDNRVYVRAGGVWVYKRNVGPGDIDTDELHDDAATDTGFIFNATGIQVNGTP